MRLLQRTVGLCNWLYNTALEQRITAWKYHRVSLTCYQQHAELPEIKEAFPEFKNVHSQVLQDVLTCLDKTYQAFFARRKTGGKGGFPRFQGSHRYHSFTYKQYQNGAYADNGFLVLSKIGRVKVLWSRPLEGTPKTVTISHEADGWYVCFSCAGVEMPALPKTGQEVGVDVGIKSFLTTSDGVHVGNPQWLRKMEKQLKWHQRRVSRRKQGSKRRKKAVAGLAKVYQTVRRQREDFHHKQSVALVKQYDVIYVEDLQVANMVKNHHLAKSISDARWAQFRAILTFKAACAGKSVVAVPPAYTSQDCSRCGMRVQKSLSVRTHICPQCGLVMDRDENGATHVKWAGQALRGVPGLPGPLSRASPRL
ncbi:MAG: IS200/IS605 family element transposase accessory protein TnpB [Ktedonobacterales bacterium]|nr:IS200/IS605 family element transposase accessory protein TnpB [Ktedonobacterales bacterium]